MEKTKLQWHPGFCVALRITLQDDMGFLEIKEEHLLGKKPLQIDALVLKKLRDRTVEKDIGKIFRRYNIIEYKSPEDYLSINDFYKVYAYACLYQSDTDKVKEIDPQEMTITFVCSCFPRKMLKHLEKVRNIRAEKQGEGIYYLTGDAIPMQLLITPELTGQENYWLQSLRTDLKAGQEIREQMEVEKKMCDALKELFAEELKEADHQGMERGRSEGMERGRSEGIERGRAVNYTL